MNQMEELLKVDHVIIDKLTLVQNSLRTKLRKLEGLDAEILAAVPDNQLEDEVQTADDYTEGIQRMLLCIKVLEPSQL